MPTSSASPTCCAWWACCPTWPSATRTSSRAASARRPGFGGGRGLGPPPPAPGTRRRGPAGWAGGWGGEEPVSALDVSIQAQVINIFKNLQKRLGLTYVFIAHDLAVVRHISDRIAVMYLGRVVEIAARDDLYETPKHPYTQALLSAVLVADVDAEASKERVVLKGEIPSPLRTPSACRFHTRCRVALERCKTQDPGMSEHGRGHAVACHLYT